MSEMLGADTRRLDLIAEGLQGSSQDIQNLRAMAHRAAAEMRHAWGGPDLERLTQRWDRETVPRLVEVSSALGTMATVLRAQAEEQRQASGNIAGSSVPMVWGGTPGGMPGGHRSVGGGVGAAAWDDDIAPWDSDLDLEQEDDGNKLGQRTAADNMKVNLAESHITFVDQSLASTEGEGKNYRYELSAAKVEAEGESSLDFDASGNLVASATVSAAAYAGYAMGALHGGNAFASTTAQGKVYAGAEARAYASASIGRDGARGHLGGEAFLGGKAEGSLGGTVAGVTAMVGAEVSYGIGVHAEVDAQLSATDVGFSADLGAALGIGTGVAFDVSVDPREVIANVGQGAEGVGEGLTLAGDQVESLLDW